MHESSYNTMNNFLSSFDKNKKIKILDVGSYSFEGLTYRSLMSPKWEYIGLDIAKGPNVDIVVDSNKPFEYPFEDETFDIIISGQCMEHVTEIWTWMKELNRILKKNGSVCIIAPSTGKEHTEMDCWRIMPKGMKFIMEWAGFKVEKVHLSNNQKWNDCVGIGKK